MSVVILFWVFEADLEIILSFLATRIQADNNVKNGNQYKWVLNWLLLGKIQCFKHVFCFVLFLSSG